MRTSAWSRCSRRSGSGGIVLAGALPARALALVCVWAARHEDELLEDHRGSM